MLILPLMETPFEIPAYAPDYGRCSVYYHGATLWNTLSPALYDAALYTEFNSNYLRTI